MTETAADRHNRLAREFIQRAGRETETAPELLVVIESALFASMLLLQSVHGMQSRQAAAMADEALQRATERFAAAGHRSPPQPKART